MPDINYRLNIDTTQLANSMSEVRSQLNMGLASNGFGIVDTGRAALGGLYDFGGTASAAGASIVSGFQNLPMPTLVHADRGISYTPHYGVVNAQASLQAEWLGRFYGPAGVAPFTPPGVGPTEYNGFLQREHERKFSEARTDAIIAGGGAVAGFAAGEVGFSAGGALGGLAGGALIGGPFGAAIGGLVGGLGGAVAANKLVDVAVGRVREAREMTSELGGIIDARRNLPLDLQRQLASEALAVGRETGTNAQQVADIVARMPQLGTMIPTTDTKEFHDQLASIVTDLKDFSSALHTSIGAAQQMMAHMERLGMKGAEGADFLIGQAGRIGMGVSPLQVYGMMRGGESMGIQAQIGMGFGGRFALDMAAEATHARLDREGLQMAGGIGGFSGALEQNVLGNAFSPMGMLQLAAAPGSQFELPTSLEGTLNQGITNLMSNFPRNFLALEVGRGEALRAVGRGRVEQMGRQSLRNTVDMLSPLLGANASEGDRELLGRHFLMQQGMNEYQAKGAAYRFLNPGAKDTTGSGYSAAVAAVRRARAQDHLAYGRSEEMEVRSDHPILSLIPGFTDAATSVNHALSRLGSGASVWEGAHTESELRDYYSKMGMAYDGVSDQSLADVDSGRIDLRKVQMPGSGTALGKQVATIAAIMGGDAKSAAGMLKTGAALTDALNGFSGDARDLQLGRSGRGAARVFHDEIMKDEAGFKRRLQDLAEALPSGDSRAVHDRMLAVFKGTDYEKDLRRGGLGQHAGEALPLLMAYSQAAGVNLGLGDSMGSNLKAWIASEHERKVQHVADGDKLKELAVTLTTSQKSHETGPAAENSVEGMTNLATLISKENRAIDGILQEVRRMQTHGKAKRPSHSTVGAH